MINSLSDLDTPLGWAEFGRDEAIAPDGDYEACIRALATAG